MFNRDTYLDLIEYRLDILKRNIINDNISSLVNILKINPEYEEPYDDIHGTGDYTKEKHDKLIKIFGIDKVARCDENFVIDINSMNPDEWVIYKKLQDINPHFILCNGYNGDLCSIEGIYQLEEFAFMDNNIKKQIYKLQYIIDYQFMIKDNPELFRNIIDYIIQNNIDLYDNSIYFTRDSFLLLADSNFNISIDEYFKLTRLEQEQLCEEYHGYCNYTMSGSILAKRKIKRIVKNKKKN